MKTIWRFLTIISAFSAIAIEEARLFQEAKIAEAVKLLGDISHDVNNLLVPVLMGTAVFTDEIMGLCEGLLSKGEPKAQTSLDLCNEAVEMLQDASKRIQYRVKEIADCVKGLTSAPQFAECGIEINRTRCHQCASAGGTRQGGRAKDGRSYKIPEDPGR